MMTLLEAIDARHSVRAYKTTPIPEDIRSQLDAFVQICNEEGDLNIAIRYDDPDGFDSRLAHYGSFRNVSNYIILAGKKDDLTPEFESKVIGIHKHNLGFEGMIKADDKALVEGMEISVPSLEDIMIHLERRS